MRWLVSCLGVRLAPHPHTCPQKYFRGANYLEIDVDVASSKVGPMSHPDPSPSYLAVVCVCVCMCVYVCLCVCVCFSCVAVSVCRWLCVLLVARVSLVVPVSVCECLCLYVCALPCMCGHECAACVCRAVDCRLCVTVCASSSLRAGCLHGVWPDPPGCLQCDCG
jgi:hypothetical protein